MILYPQNRDRHRQIAEWVSDHIEGGVDLEGVYYSLAVIRKIKGEPVVAAGFVYHGWRDGTCEISAAAASPIWATRQAISAVLSYGFIGLDQRRINSISHVKNKRDHKLIEGIGFRRDGVLPDQYPDGAAVIHGMTRRWFLKSKWNYEQESTARTAAA